MPESLDCAPTDFRESNLQHRFISLDARRGVLHSRFSSSPAGRQDVWELLFALSLVRRIANRLTSLLSH